MSPRPARWLQQGRIGSSFRSECRGRLNLIRFRAPPGDANYRLNRQFQFSECEPRRGWSLIGALVVPTLGGLLRGLFTRREQLRHSESQVVVSGLPVGFLQPRDCRHQSRLGIVRANPCGEQKPENACFDDLPPAHTSRSRSRKVGAIGREPGKHEITLARGRARYSARERQPNSWEWPLHLRFPAPPF